MVVFLWFIFITAFVAIVFELACMSEVFAKAEKPGWGCIVPIYGIVLICDIAGKPRWWTLLSVIPLVNVYAYIILSYGVARHFERSDRFGAGLVLLPVVFSAILAFSDSEYTPFEFEAEGAMSVGGASPSSPVTHPPQEVTSDASPVTRPQKAVTSPSDSVRQRPRLARCPFCRSTTFRVVEEAGSRRCSGCHSVLPSYVQGNA